MDIYREQDLFSRANKSGWGVCGLFMYEVIASVALSQANKSGWGVCGLFMYDVIASVALV